MHGFFFSVLCVCVWESSTTCCATPFSHHEQRGPSTCDAHLPYLLISDVTRGNEIVPCTKHGRARLVTCHHSHGHSCRKCCKAKREKVGWHIAHIGIMS